MKNKLWKNLKKYFCSTKCDINASKVVKEFSFRLMQNTETANFNLNTILCEEAKSKCKEMDYNIDKVYVFTAYYADLIKNPEEISHVKSDSDDYIAVHQRKDGTYFCAIFIGSFVEVSTKITEREISWVVSSIM